MALKVLNIMLLLSRTKMKCPYGVYRVLSGSNICAEVQIHAHSMSSASRLRKRFAFQPWPFKWTMSE